MVELKTPVILHTDGSGLWSNRAAEVSVTALEVPYIDEESDFGELCVHFDTDTWDVEQHGLIYTDNLFERELKTLLKSMGLDASDIDYSEQGMQGDEYVSLDVGSKFIRSWKKKFPVTE